MPPRRRPFVPEPRPLVSVVIVSYNTRSMTLDCLRALYASLGDLPAEVWVVDNASTDGSAQAVREAFPQACVVANTDNKGFGAANNQALKQARGEFLMLLNTDAFAQPDTVERLVAYLQLHPRAAIVGPRLLNKDGSVQQSCYRYPSPGRAWLENMGVSALLARHPQWGDYKAWPHDREQTVDWVIGACLLLRRAAYDEVGGFDETYFMYAEETDWQRRFRDKGWDIAFTPSATVTHLGGASGASEVVRVNAHFFDSLDYYTRKHHGLGGLILLRGAMVVGCGLRALVWSLVALAVPSRRTTARAKARFQAWLFRRQATHWRGLRPSLEAL